MDKLQNAVPPFPIVNDGVIYIGRRAVLYKPYEGTMELSHANQLDATQPYTPSKESKMTRDQAIELARTHAKAQPQGYYSEPFQPHEWVISAILAAANEEKGGLFMEDQIKIARLEAYLAKSYVDLAEARRDSIAFTAGADPDKATFDPQEGLLNSVNQVYFRAGLLACREYMARFVESENAGIAASIRANWWPALGEDFGPPRKLEWDELTIGEYGEASFHYKTVDEVSPTLEALPIALGFIGVKK